MALMAIAVVIPLAILWTLYSAGWLSSGNQQFNLQTSARGTHRPQVVTSFYPLYDFAKNVGGDTINVTSMVPIGVEPHDWEPTPGQIKNLIAADVFVYNGAGIDSWATKIETAMKVNASDGLVLIRDKNGHPDPHTWLDPIMAERQVELIRNALVKADPENTDYYVQNAQSYISRLESLDTRIRSELSTCSKTDFIAFHNAFTYFANRYGLHQHTILGEDPEGDIPPRTLTELIKFAKQYGISVVYSEDLLDPRNAQTIANEIPGGKVLVLSPIEGIDKEASVQGIGYVEKMQQNLENLKEGLNCN